MADAKSIIASLGDTIARLIVDLTTTQVELAETQAALQAQMAQNEEDKK